MQFIRLFLLVMYRVIYHPPIFFHEEEIIYKRERATCNKKISSLSCSLDETMNERTKPGRKEEKNSIIRQIEKLENGKLGKFNCLDGPQTKRNDHRSITVHGSRNL